MAKQTFYGLRAHLRICWPGVIVGFSLAPTNVHELEVAEVQLEGVQGGWALGDRNHWSPNLAQRLGQQGSEPLAPYKSKNADKEP